MDFKKWTEIKKQRYQDNVLRRNFDSAAFGMSLRMRQGMFKFMARFFIYIMVYPKAI